MSEARALLVTMTQDDLRAEIRAAIEPLRLELERLRSGDGAVLVSLPEAARRLGITLRSVQKRAKDGRLQVEIVGGERMARLPASLGQG